MYTQISNTRYSVSSHLSRRNSLLLSPLFLHFAKFDLRGLSKPPQVSQGPIREVGIELYLCLPKWVKNKKHFEPSLKIVYTGANFFFTSQNTCYCPEHLYSPRNHFIRVPEHSYLVPKHFFTARKLILCPANILFVRRKLHYRCVHFKSLRRIFT